MKDNIPKTRILIDLYSRMNLNTGLGNNRNCLPMGYSSGDTSAIPQTKKPQWLRPGKARGWRKLDEEIQTTTSYVISSPNRCGQCSIPILIWRNQSVKACQTLMGDYPILEKKPNNTDTFKECNFILGAHNHKVGLVPPSAVLSVSLQLVLCNIFYRVVGFRNMNTRFNVRELRNRSSRMPVVYNLKTPF